MTATNPLFFATFFFHTFDDLECSDLINMWRGQLVEPHLHPRLGLLSFLFVHVLSKDVDFVVPSIFCLTVYFFNSFRSLQSRDLNAARDLANSAFSPLFSSTICSIPSFLSTASKSLDWLVILLIKSITSRFVNFSVWLASCCEDISDKPWDASEITLFPDKKSTLKQQQHFTVSAASQ